MTSSTLSDRGVHGEEDGKEEGREEGREPAEFVEQPETLAMLREIGVDYIRGYGVAKPEPVASTGVAVKKK